MSNQERPDGWTDRMLPLETDLVGGREVTPEFGGAGGQRMGAPANAGVVAPTDTPPAGNASQGSPQEGQANMSQGEQYWYDQCMEARSKLSDVAPLVPYIDVISYLDANPDATKLVMEHMSNGINDPNSNLPDPNAGDNTGIHQNMRTPVPQHGQNGSYGGVNNLEQSKGKFEENLRTANMDYLKKNGIPEHEADKYIQWLMNPGDLTPDQLFGMYRTAQGGPPATPNTNQPTNNNEQPLANNQQPPSPMGTPADGMAMSVAGMNGGTVDPRDEANEQRHVANNNMLDPNNA